MRRTQKQKHHPQEGRLPGSSQLSPDTCPTISISLFSHVLFQSPAFLCCQLPNMGHTLNISPLKLDFLSSTLRGPHLGVVLVFWNLTTEQS